MLPSASPTANSSFQTTYDGLLDQARDRAGRDGQALGRPEPAGAGAIRACSSWSASCARAGPGSSTCTGWKARVARPSCWRPTRRSCRRCIDRYGVSNCANNGKGRYCRGPSPGPGVIGNSQSFTTIGLPPTTYSGFPRRRASTTRAPAPTTATTTPTPRRPALMSRIWGPVSSTCNYQPGNPNTALDVTAVRWESRLPRASAPTRLAGRSRRTPAHPVTYASSAVGAVSATAGVVRAHAARAGSTHAPRAPSDCQRAAQRAMLGPLRFTGRVALSRGLRPRRMRVVVERTLFEHGRREELARSGSGRRLRPFALRHVRDGLFTSRAARRASGAPASAASAPTRAARGSTCASPGCARATFARCARSFRPASAVPAGRSSSRRACACATAR